MQADESGRLTARDPEALLRQVEAVERAKHRGQLKIFLSTLLRRGLVLRIVNLARDMQVRVVADHSIRHAAA